MKLVIVMLKQIHPSKPIYSVRVTLNWQALGVRESKNTVTWFWIGSHEEYNKLMRRLKKVNKKIESNAAPAKVNPKSWGSTKTG